jgi:hypothetical protein
MKIFYHPSDGLISLELPGEGNNENNVRMKKTTLYGLKANTAYSVSSVCYLDFNQEKVMTNEEGILQFNMKYSTGCTTTTIKV